MRSFGLALVTVLAVSAQARAQDAPDSAFTPMLRAYSKLAAVADECGRAYPLDGSRTKAYASAALEVARKAGAQQSDIAAERRRRAAEIKITGARPWCMSARAGLRETGAGELFPAR